ncbi:eotaxin-like [Xiphophorus maculatus]|uniref:eotaxin-like n=1 Tax=Xiphophorus maculatus TaxID=8083 RepID=UPI000C6CF97A|nr:eotaxin-like [Xiphophorus maculatus]XP_023188721.1 eotaxin-like [Xiphophorus maculatus]XP_027871791.1 eotaxin-like [Xiphophorus couchianus]XP_027871792.1 eotaxin-like [Xiphophorus couchianus]
MKIQLSLCLLALLCSLRSSSAAPVGPGVIRGACCQGNGNTPIPIGKVKEMKNSPIHCKVRSVIVTTESNKKFCLDPTWSWTQTLKKEFGKEKRLR